MSDFTGAIESAMSGSASTDSATSPVATESQTAETSVSTAEPSASVTAPAADSGTATSVTSPEGQMIPYPRFREVNEERTRLKHQAERLRWAQEIAEPDAPAIAQFYKALKADPINTLLNELDGALGNPEYAQIVRSRAAKWMGTGKDSDPMPEPDLQAADGTLVYGASQQQKRDEWLERRLLERVGQQIAPLQQFAETARAERARADIKATADQWAHQTYAQWSQKPHFTEHKAQIAQLMQANPEMGIADAYAEVLVSQVLPKLSATERSTVVAAMQQKAAAVTTDPSRGPAQGLPKPKSFKEAFERLAGQAG